MLVAGIILGALSIPAFLNAFSESRAPRAAAIVALSGGVLIFLALKDHSAGYSWAELPQVFGRVFKRLLN